MKKLIICLCCILVLSCKTDKAINTENSIASINTIVQKNQDVKIPNNPYQIKLNLNKLKNANYDLEIIMKLNDSAHFVSPNAKRDFSGKFSVFYEDNEVINKLGILKENPLSKEEIDDHPFVRGTVNWVNVNTTYTQQIQVKTKENFQVLGHIQFTIEPRCTLEKIPFIIKNKNGDLTFKIFKN
ncbi:hypothetical protein [Olleya sp. R77988]|uniref:hypothetical protein n=1 Tax=Olleya sp. R77988 TaxID=3093875 RepID=UPI0037CC4473